MRVLICAAHSDDELLGVGGTIAQHAEHGDEICVLIAADCRAARDLSHIPTLHPAARNAARVLGILPANVGFIGYRAMTVATQPELELNRAYEDIFRAFKPDIVYTHHSGDLNSDHRAVSRAVEVAARPFGAHRPQRVLHFETPSSTGFETPCDFKPNCFVDITSTIDRKLEAMACYAEELREPPHPRGLAALKTRAAYWGQQCGCGFAEPFMLMREVVEFSQAKQETNGE